MELDLHHDNAIYNYKNPTILWTTASQGTYHLALFLKNNCHILAYFLDFPCCCSSPLLGYQGKFLSSPIFSFFFFSLFVLLCFLFLFSSPFFDLFSFSFHL